MAAEVVQLKLTLVTVVVSAVAPVAVQNGVPLELFKQSLARGTMVPRLAVLRIHNVKLTVEPLAMVPESVGSPLWLSKAWIKYSPVAALFRLAESRATLVASGPAVFNWSSPLVLEASLCR